MVDKMVKYLPKKYKYLVEEGDDNGIFMCMQHYSSKVCFMIRQSKITQTNK